MQTHFLNRDILNLAIGIALMVLSVVLYFKNRFSWSIAILTIGAFVLRFFVIKLDPFLYPWDEAFHALVAKNTMENPFKPMLYANPILPYDARSWVSNHIWVHGPSVLWLIALSYKIFGVNELATRIPSLIMSTLLVPVLYRMGVIIRDKKTGYLTAFLFATANYQLEIVSGILNGDHSDITFMFFVCASFWAWFEYKHSNKKHWLIWIGFFSGVAVLTKWIMGFLIFFCWFITVVANKNERNRIISYLDIGKSFLISFIISLTWYVHCFISFPQETRITLQSYSSNFTSVVESHSGGGYYHLDLLGVQYGWIVPFIIIPSLYFLYKTLHNKKDYKVMLIAWLLFVEIFYAIARTKMPLFTIIVAPVVYLVLGNFIFLAFNYLLSRIKKYGVWVIAVLLVLTGYMNIGIAEIEGHHTATGLMVGQREQYIHNVAVFKKVISKLPQKGYTLFNCPDAIRAMFYTGMTAYPGVPDSTMFIKLEKQNIKLAIFDDEKLPKYILNDPKILKLQDTLMHLYQ